MRILVAEDDPVAARLIDAALKDEGITSKRAERGQDVIDLVSHDGFDAIILASRLPDMDGSEVIRRLAAANVSTPVLLLLGAADADNEKRNLALGVEGYLTKPFQKNELIAHIHSIVHHSKASSEPVIRMGKLVVNPDTRTVDVDGRPLDVTANEYSILELFFLHKGTTLTTDMFLDHLYGGIDAPALKIVDVFMAKLRKKIASATGCDHYI